MARNLHTAPDSVLTSSKAKDDTQNADPNSLVLLFKHARITVVLLAEQLTPLTTIKSNLLTILQERYPEGLPSPTSIHKTPIPSSADELVFGTLIDSFAPNKGFEELQPSEIVDKDRETAQTVGWKNGSIIAFAFGEGNVLFDVEWSTYEDNYAEDGEGNED